MSTQIHVDPITQLAIEVEHEVRRAIQLHAGFNSLHEAKAVIEEEFDEFWELVKINPNKLTLEAQQKRISDLRMELVQTAAMCIRTILDCRVDVDFTLTPPAPKPKQTDFDPEKL